MLTLCNEILECIGVVILDGKAENMDGRGWHHCIVSRAAACDANIPCRAPI